MGMRGEGLQQEDGRRRYRVWVKGELGTWLDGTNGDEGGGTQWVMGAGD